MSEPLPAEQRRVGDADRERVAEQLRQAAGDGRLTLGELDQRLDAGFAARTYAELAALTRDLPATGFSSAPLPARVTRRKGRGWSLAVMSGSKQSGRWVVGSQHVAVSIMGGVELDLQQAELEAGEVTIWAFAVMGGVDVAVPPDCALEANGWGIMGGFDSVDKAPPPPSAAPVIRVRGFSLMGAVNSVRRATERRSVEQRARGELED